MQEKTTTIRLTVSDQECLEVLREQTGVQSVSDLIRYSLREARSSRKGEAQTAAPAPTTTDQLLAVLEKHRAALALWKPMSFEEVRAKTVADEAFARLRREIPGLHDAR